MVANNADLLLQKRTVNPLHDIFVSRWDELPLVEKDYYFRGMEFMIGT